MGRTAFRLTGPQASAIILAASRYWCSLIQFFRSSPHRDSNDPFKSYPQPH